MLQYQNIAKSKNHTEKYMVFKGADFSTDPSRVDSSRSPMPLNLIPDEGGSPQKRPGTRTIKTFDGKINGLFSFFSDSGEKLICHAGTKIYAWDFSAAAPTLLKSGIADARSVGFNMAGKLWLLTGSEYLYFDGVKIEPVSAIATPAETSIGRTPTGGGTRLYPVNLLTPRRINGFLADGTSTAYQLDGSPIDSVEMVTVNGAVVGSSLYSVDLTLGKVNFNSASTVPKATGGEDNVIIEFSRTVSGYYDRIAKCSIVSSYGIGASDRVFFSGNGKYKNLDWVCEHNNPAFIPDISYSTVGSEDSAIMGYLNMGENLAIIKEDGSPDVTLFLRNADLTASGEVQFKLRRSVSAIGAVSPYCIKSFRDDPLFLSRSGVSAITTIAITQERTVKPRSQFINARLSKEPNLKEAVSCCFGDLFFLAVNNHIYVADSKQQAFKESLADNYGYEWYYWEGIPVRIIWEHDGLLFFGGLDGKLRQLNTDIDTMRRFNDDGAAIIARWATGADSHGDFMRLKTMPKSGSGIMCKPYTSSSVRVLIATDHDFGILARSASMSIFDFSDLDFNNFSFNTQDTPQIIPINKKTKKYKTIQFLIENREVNQGFGIYGIIMRYRFGGYVKR